MDVVQQRCDYQMLRTRGFSMPAAWALVILRELYLRGKFDPPEG